VLQKTKVAFCMVDPWQHFFFTVHLYYYIKHLLEAIAWGQFSHTSLAASHPMSQHLPRSHSTQGNHQSEAESCNLAPGTEKIHLTLSAT